MTNVITAEFTNTKDAQQPLPNISTCSFFVASEEDDRISVSLCKESHELEQSDKGKVTLESFILDDGAWEDRQRRYRPVSHRSKCGNMSETTLKGYSYLVQTAVSRPSNSTT
jgi:hypothetical protein